MMKIIITILMLLAIAPAAAQTGGGSKPAFKITLTDEVYDTGTIIARARWKVMNGDRFGIHYAHGTCNDTYKEPDYHRWTSTIGANTYGKPNSIGTGGTRTVPNTIVKGVYMYLPCKGFYRFCVLREKNRKQACTEYQVLGAKEN